MPDDKTTGKASFDKDSVKNTLIVAIGLSLVCSILVASTAVILKPRQEQNEEQFRQRIILEVASLMEEDGDISELYKAIEPRMVELETGEYVDSIDVESCDTAAAANDPELGVVVPAELDIGNIQRRSRYAPVYLVREDGEVSQIILPVYGSGLWAAMYGYLSVETDGVTVVGLRFYQHGETPGLGDQIDKSEWRQQWVGKQVRDAEGVPRIEVVRGVVPADRNPEESQYQVDGLSGATLTGRGAMNLVRYWTGPHGFGPFLDNISQSDDASL